MSDPREEIAPLDGTLFGPENPCFGCAPHHPAGLRLRMERVPAGVKTRFSPRDEHQGPPGLVHGGLLMTLADEVGAWAVIAETGLFGFTASFEGRIAKGARIDQALEVTGRVIGPARRVAKVEVEIRQGGELVSASSFRFALLTVRAAEALMGRAMPDGWRRFARD